MGSYKNPKTRAKAYKKSTSEKLKYANEHKEKELAKLKEKKQNINKYNKKKVEKKPSKVENKTNKPKQVIKVVKHKKPVDNKPKFKPCAKTIIQYNSNKRKDRGLYIMIPVIFKTFSGKLNSNSLDRLIYFINTNAYIWNHITSKHKFADSVSQGIVYEDMSNSWKRKCLKTNLNKMYYGLVKDDIFAIKYEKHWYLVFDIENIMRNMISKKFEKGIVSYKHYITNLYAVGGSVAVLGDDRKLNRVMCRQIINVETEEDKVWFYWNDKESYGDICKEYHRLLKNANNIKKNIDLQSFSLNVALMMEFTEVVVKTSPFKNIVQNAWDGAPVKYTYTV